MPSFKDCLSWQRIEDGPLGNDCLGTYLLETVAVKWSNVQRFSVPCTLRSGFAVHCAVRMCIGFIFRTLGPPREEEPNPPLWGGKDTASWSVQYKTIVRERQ